MSAEAAPRTARKKRARWAIVALVVVVVAVLAIAVPMVTGGAPKKATTVETVTVTPSRLAITASADGQTEADVTRDVYPEVSGTVVKLDVSTGDTVAAGDVLFTIDDTDLRAAVRQANAQLSSARSQVAQATEQVQQARLSQLQARNRLHKLESLPATQQVPTDITEAKRQVIVATSGLSSANASLTSAKVARRNAEKSYAEARDDVDKATVTAPVGGVVTAVNVTDGGSVSVATGGSSAAGGTGAAGSSSASAGSSAPIVISDNTELIATVQVNEVDIADVSAGQAATVTFDAAAGLAIPAKVRRVSPNAVTTGNVRTYEVELDLATQSARLRPGMTASAVIETLTLADALLVPKTAVRVDGTSKFVTVVKPDGSQEKRTITTGRSDEVSVQVLSGLKSGEKVATSFVTATAAAGFSLIPPAPGGMGGN
jgi:macrolide-specific efflux system membrane fusion protein